MGEFDPTRILESVYRATLMRSADSEGLAAFSAMLMADGDLRQVLQAILTSDEFAINAPTLLSRNHAYRFWPALEATNYLSTGGPLAFSGFQFRLSEDGPLGPKGSSLIVPNDRSMLPSIFSQAKWQEEEQEFLAERLSDDKPRILVDIGANIGLFSLQALHRFECLTKSFCIEPDPDNFAALSWNLRRFEPRRARLFNVALSTDEGRATLFRDPSNFGNYSLLASAMEGRSHLTVEVGIETVSAWAGDHLAGEETIVWKSDTQGLDETIVAATPPEVWRRVECAIIELWRIPKPTYDRGEFLRKISLFERRRLNEWTNISDDDIAAYIEGTDGDHGDLYLWNDV